MWYPSAVTVAAAELVTLADARLQARTELDAGFDDELTRLITVARNHVEKYCNIRIGSQTIVAKCDSFADLARLPDAPVTSITSIGYVDSDGTPQTLSTDIYELRADDLEAAVVLKFNQSWPAIQPGSRITVTAVVGYATAPPAVHHAMLFLVAYWFSVHEPVNIGNISSDLPQTFDALLANHRRGP